MKTIAQQLKVKEFPFKIKDKDGNQIYSESSDGYIEDKRTTEMTIAEIEKELNITNLKIKK